VLRWRFDCFNHSDKIWPQKGPDLSAVYYICRAAGTAPQHLAIALAAVKGSDRGMTTTTTTTTASPGGEESGLAQLNLMTKREEKEEKDACSLPELGCLATYVGYVPCVSRPGVVSTPTQYRMYLYLSRN
jgi:hypothetical protein